MMLPAIAGLVIIIIVLWDAFETIVLPRRVTHRFRLTRAFYIVTWRPWRALGRHIRHTKPRETFLSFFGPLSLLFLFILWAVVLILGFGLVYYGAANAEGVPHRYATAAYLSGTTFFTLGLGDVTPHTSIERFVAVVESGLGFGFLALVLSYLPVIYQAFSRREVNIVLLDARAGSPPTAAELLRRHSGPHGLDALQMLLRDWERWAAEILESHVSYPVVSYFRSQHNNESWVAALAAILDASALLISISEGECARQARLTFAMCRHTVVDLTQIFSAAPRAEAPDRLPPADLQRMRTTLAAAGFMLPDTPAISEKLIKMRHMYEPYLSALSNHLYMELPPWILAKEITDNWKTSAWGRISGFANQPQQDASPDDHSA
jgi:hypothetical protein